MTTYINEGKTINYTNATGTDISVTDAVVVGDRIFIAAVDIANGDTQTVRTEGAWEFDKTAAEVVAQGVLMYFDAATKKATLSDASGANNKIGFAIEASAGAETTVKIKLSV